MTSKQRISSTFVPAGQQAMHERLENWGRWAEVRFSADPRDSVALQPHLLVRVG